jgi:MFS family permease
VVLQGAANGMATLARATSLAEIFGSRHYGAIAGAVALGANGARAIGPVGASLLWVGLGSYPAVFWLLAAGLVVSALAVLIAGAGVKSKRVRAQTPGSPRVEIVVTTSRGVPALTARRASRKIRSRSQDGERSSTVRALDCGSRG